MDQQTRLRPSLVPLQVPHDSTSITVKANKRLRVTSRNHFKGNAPYQACNEKQQLASSFRARQPDVFIFQSRQGGSPLPPLKWANRDDVWKHMCWKEHIYIRDVNVFRRHPEITPRMRAILYEWISEVSEVYKLHRETFYLCMDFVDRYLSEVTNFPKKGLQLVGVTALFIAAKLEEIYPPTVKDFAYVTDGACTAEEILDCELIILKTLKWALSPVTINHWLLVYLQVVANETNEKLVERGILEWRCREFLMPQFQRLQYIRLTQLTDLCAMDEGVLRFPYSVVAASAFYHLFQPDQWTLLVSGYAWQDLAACISWMAPFAQVIKGDQPNVKIFPDVRQDDMHNIQAHFAGYRLLEKAKAIALECSQSYASPPCHASGQFSLFPTPPQSIERPLQYVGGVPAWCGSSSQRQKQQQQPNV